MIRQFSSTKKTIEIDPKYAEAYSNLGLIYCLQAQDYASKTTADVNDPKYSKEQAKIKKFYEEARPYYEKARDLKPDQKICGFKVYTEFIIISI